MRCHRITSTDELLRLAKPWRRLAQGWPMLAPEWLIPWWQHYGHDASGCRRDELFVLCVCDDQNQLIGLAPWYVTPSNLNGNVIRFLGSGEVCGDYLTVLCSPGRETQVTNVIADWLTSHQSQTCSRLTGGGEDHWDLLDLDGVEAKDPTMQMLAAACAERGAITHCRSGINCWRLHLPARWDDLPKMVSKPFRRRIRGLQRMYFDTRRARMQVVQTRCDWDRGFHILVELHQKLWESRGEPGSFSAARFAKFHQDATRRLLDAGSLRLCWLEVDGRPVAAEYLLASAGILYAYQSGRDPTASHHQPGHLLLMAILRAAIDEGYQALDFLRGDEPYKAHWRAQPQPSVAYRILPGTPVSRLRHRVWVTGRLAHRCIQSSRRTLARSAS